MAGPPRAVAVLRTAVRPGLRASDRPVLAACSGGADSVALAAALAFEARSAGVRVGGITVDHGLQPGSAERAERTAQLLHGLGLDPVLVRRVAVGAGGGPEGAARTARYRALAAAAADLGTRVALGHTLDDQAETVLLGLGRGSGPRSVAGMVPERTADGTTWWRPLLGVRRATTDEACADQGLAVWDDPWNADPAYTRARLRGEVLPLMEDVLGGGVAPALARTAELLREDLDALDELAAAELARLAGEAGDGGLPARELGALPAALRRRVLRGWLRAAGVPDLQAVHLRAVEALVTRWRGQGRVDLPDGAGALRTSGRLVLSPPEARGTRPEDAPQTREESPPVSEPASAPAELGNDHGYGPDIDHVLLSQEQIQAKITELAEQVDRDYAGREVLLVGVLKGAVLFMSDFARALRLPTQMEFMAVSSYGSATSSSGVVRILKDLDRDISDRHVLVIEDIIDSGLTLSWLLKNLGGRRPASLEVCALLRKPDAVKVDVPVRYIGFDIPNEFVVGYGLDYAERYRDLPYIATLRPEVYSG
ncbi:hypoxanthine phosphoribosyltransferase [Geodermatophilus obscurus]|uniref:tRNA(Ile)-lysidine synthase n=1 Tax=Geodermatophilus obscurus TaxID=1861 RepID=A0A1M7V0Z1_9ACTN|nr:hypoxanthine phosphoribosyltransferase [Geodermatophilus obscurus]